MDIAKIRKKAKEQTGVKPQEPQPVSQRADTGPLLPSEPAQEIPEDEQQGTPSPQGPERSTELQAQAASADTGESSDLQRIELLTFRLATEEFAFRVADVEEILRPQKITKVPSMPDYVKGITSLRGKIIPVIDLKVRLALNRAEPAGHEERESAGKILIIDGPNGFIGAAVDRVLGVVGVAQVEVLEPPAHLTEAEKKFLEGVVVIDKRFISVVKAADTTMVEI